MKDFSEVAAPGKYIADMIPPLGNLPPWMQWWKKSVGHLYQRQVAIWTKYWNTLTAQMEAKRLGHSKSAPECFVKQVIEHEYQKLGISELQAAFLAGCKCT